MYSRAAEFVTHAENLFAKHPSMEITALVPEWVESDKWTTVKTYPKGYELFKYPDGELLSAVVSPFCTWNFFGLDARRGGV